MEIQGDRPGRQAGCKSAGGRCLGVGLTPLLLGAVVAATSPARASRHAQTANSAYKTVFKCEKAFAKGSRERSRCFSQLPGASCAHPLEVQKTNPNFRGDTRYFTVKLEDEPDGEGTLLSYEWAPKSNVAICPYPNGAVFKVSLFDPKLKCQKLGGEEICSHEYNTKNIPERTSSHGGSFMYVMPQGMSWYLDVKGYFIHPPWEHHR
jgi:hypothetical protein